MITFGEIFYKDVVAEIALRFLFPIVVEDDVKLPFKLSLMFPLNKRRLF